MRRKWGQGRGDYLSYEILFACFEYSGWVAAVASGRGQLHATNRLLTEHRFYKKSVASLYMVAVDVLNSV